MNLMTLVRNSCSYPLMRRTAHVLPLCLFALVTFALPARAASTGWSEVEGGAVRLISAGPPESDGSYAAGLEFMLDPGWHTYWRYPGDAGIPPQIDISGANNVRDHEVLYPVPERYSDGFSTSVVYHDGIVLPIKVRPERPNEPVHLDLHVFFGVCSDICVPGEASLSLELSPSDAQDRLSAKLIARDLAAVPAKRPNGGAAITSVVLSEKRDALRISARVPESTDIDLFAAGPESSFIGLPRLTSHDGGQAVWTLPLKGLRTNDRDATLRLVLKTGRTGVEHLEPIQPGWLR